MRPNPLRKRYEQNDLQLGTWITTVTTPAILRLLKSAGMDFACIDLEHTGMSIDTVTQMALLSNALDFPIMVRPPRADREWITRLLDIGVWNILCPQVSSAAHATEIAAASHYAPAGSRGTSSFGPAMDFQRVDRDAWRRFANQQVFIVALLETQSALTELDEIAATQGIDALMIGPGDMAQDMSFNGAFDQGAAMRQVTSQVAAAALRHGKKNPVFAQSVQDGKLAIEAGNRMVLISSEMRILHDAYCEVSIAKGQRTAISA